MMDVEGGGGGGSPVKYYNNGKSKDKLSSIEQYAYAYNRLDAGARSSIINGSIVSFCLLEFLSYVMCADFASFACYACFILSTYAQLFCFWLLCWIFAFDEGPPEMQAVAEPIKEGAEGYFHTQYGMIAKISLVFAVALFVMYASKDETSVAGQPISPLALGTVTMLTFLIGAACSALSGYAGMWVSVRANVRVSAAARKCYNDTIQICFRAGTFTAALNVALVIQGLSFSVIVMRKVFPTIPFAQLPLLLVGYGFGASLVAMFAQLGGGIYTKGADVGADLVGKVEQGIPEDDPRNPAVIADLVGDNVGDCAGQCADTFESIAAEIMSAMILGGAMVEAGKLDHDVAAGFVTFPLFVHCMDIVVSTLGCMMVHARKGPINSATIEDPLAIMKRCFGVTIVLGITGFATLCRFCLNVPSHPGAWKYFACCGAIGIVTAYLFVIITQYYTDYEYCKVQSIVEASVTGPATNIIAGMAVGMESTALPVITISVALVGSYNLGLQSGVAGSSNVAGLFGTAVATMGMLSTAVFVLAMSSFGPIADNAGGIVEMSQQPEDVRIITDRLDAVGNVTKANTKGFSVGSASLACFLLFSAFMDEVGIYSKSEFKSINIAIPEVFVGGLLGAMLVFLFSAWSMSAVSYASQAVIVEVRRQFREHPGIMEYKEKPDYRQCVGIVSDAALRAMVKPGLLSILSPVVVGAVFRYIGDMKGDPQLGAQVTGGFLMFATSTGILMALFLNNAGGAWDNSKKYVETGRLGGKNSETHKATVVGDTVGDPCKDTAGPSVHVLIKLISTVTMVMTPVLVGPAMAREPELMVPETTT
jgi:H(+)-translocating pyrophosphatase